MPHRFRVCMVWGLALWSGSFRFAIILTRTRGSMSNNAHRVAFMAHYNGDAEGWLDQLLVLKALVQCACYVPKDCAERLTILPIGCIIGQKKLFCKKSCAPLLLMAGIESGDRKEFYRNFYRNVPEFFKAWGTAIPPPPQLQEGGNFCGKFVCLRKVANFSPGEI